MYKVMKRRLLVVALAIIVFIGNFGIVSAKDIREVTLKGGKGKPGEYVTVDVTMKKTEDVAGIQCTISYDTSKIEIENKDIEVGKALEGFMYEKNVIKEKSYLKFSAISKEGMNKKDDNVLFSLQFKIKEDAKEGKIPVTIDYLLITDTMNQDMQSSTKNTEIQVKKGAPPGQSDKKVNDDTESKGNKEVTLPEPVKKVDVQRAEVAKILTALLKQINY